MKNHNTEYFQQIKRRRINDIIESSTMLGGFIGLTAGILAAVPAILFYGIPFLGLPSIGATTVGLIGIAKLGVGLATIICCGAPPILAGLGAGIFLGALVGLVVATVVTNRKSFKNPEFKQTDDKHGVPTETLDQTLVTPRNKNQKNPGFFARFFSARSKTKDLESDTNDEASKINYRHSST